jgi:hypothetical protein
MVTSPNGFGPEKDYAGEGQQHIKKGRPVLSSERAPHKKKTTNKQDRNCQRVIIYGHEPQMGLDTKTY